MKGKIYTPQEASRMVPLLSRVADDLVATHRKVQTALQALELEQARLDDEAGQGLGATGSESHGRVEALEREVARRLEWSQGYVDEVEALGGAVRDCEMGCIDFYGEIDGLIVYLCWKRGEHDVSHWHHLDEGYAHRRPVPSTALAVR